MFLLKIDLGSYTDVTILYTGATYYIYVKIKALYNAFPQKSIFTHLKTYFLLIVKSVTPLKHVLKPQTFCAIKNYINYTW